MKFNPTVLLAFVASRQCPPGTKNPWRKIHSKAYSLFHLLPWKLSATTTRSSLSSRFHMSNDEHVNTLVNDANTPCSDPNGSRFLWNGPLFGRLTKTGRTWLLDRGWTHLTFDPTKGTLQIDGKNCESSEESRSFYTPTDSSLASSTEGLPNCNTGKQRNLWHSNQRLAFVWPNKTGPQIDIDDNDVAVVRPYPAHITNLLDDKVLLANLLQGRLDLAPPVLSLTELESFFGIDNNVNDYDSNFIDDRHSYFVKHRSGAQGKSVYVMNREDLKHWWNKVRCPEDFVVQREVITALYKGYKFVLRCHILMFHRHSNNRSGNGDNESTTNFAAYLHRDIICHSHAVKYYDRTDDCAKNPSMAVAAQISNAKYNWKKSSKHQFAASTTNKQFHPPPVQMLEELDPSHPAYDSLSEIRACCRQLIELAEPRFGQLFEVANTETSKNNPGITTSFALLGVDLLIEDSNQGVQSDLGLESTGRRGGVMICEVNSHPALGWGTMANVPKDVFDRLIEDTLTILLKPPLSPDGHREGTSAGNGFLNLC